MRVTSLAENTAVQDTLGAEHGLSLYIEANGHKILFDMGQSGLFADNAQKMGIDLREVDTAVVSHGHYDHGGGLEKFLEINTRAEVYISRYAFEPHYNGNQKYIGLPARLAGKKRLKYTEGRTAAGNGLTLFSCAEKKREHAQDSSGLTVMRADGEIVPDDFRHEQYLLIEENEKKILVSGCSHRGILDIAGWFLPDVLIGGFHFSKLPLDETLAGYARYLAGFQTEFYTCHCTGTEQYIFMKQYMDRLHYLSGGQCIEI